LGRKRQRTTIVPREPSKSVQWSTFLPPGPNLQAVRVKRWKANARAEKEKKSKTKIKISDDKLRQVKN